MADEKKTVILEFEVDVDQSITSINKLTAANKELRKERNELNLASKEGQKRAQELNAQIDSNTAQIKANVSAIEKQKINIGNYGSALDKLVPGMGKFTGNLQESANASGGFTAGLKSMAQGIIGATRASLAFIATPIGAILAAISLAVAGVVAYFKRFEFVLDIIENAVTKVTAVFDSFIQNLDKVAAIMGDVFTGNFDEAAKKTGELATEFGNAADEAQRLLDATRELEDAELKYRLESAAAANQIKAWVVASKNKNLSIEESNALLQKASDLENELTAEAAKNAQTRADIEEGKLVASKKAQLEAANLLRQTGEDQKAYIDRLIGSGIFSPEQLEPLIAAYEKVQQEASAGLAFQEKVANQQAALAEKEAAARDKAIAAREKEIELIKKQAEEQAKLSEQERLARIQRLEDSEKSQIEEGLQTEFKVRTNFNQQLNDTIAAQNEAARKKEVTDAKKAADLIAQTEQQKFNAAMAVSDGILGILDEQGAAYKAVATAQTLISTYSAATKAYEAAFLPIPTVASPALGVAFASAAVLQGLANVAAINGIQFADGGVVLKGRSHAAGGIPIEAEGDEIILTKGVYRNPQLRSMASAINVAGGGVKFADGGIVTRSISQPIDQNFDVLNIVRNMPPGEVSVVEINRSQRKVKVKQNISKR